MGKVEFFVLYLLRCYYVFTCLSKSFKSGNTVNPEYLTGANVPLKYKRNIRLESSISGNIRKFRFPKFFRATFFTKKFYRLRLESALGNYFCKTYSFTFGETSPERPKNVPKWHPQREVLGRNSGRHFNQNPWNRFFMDFFSIFPDSKCISGIVLQK